MTQEEADRTARICIEAAKFLCEERIETLSASGITLSQEAINQEFEAILQRAIAKLVLRGARE